MKHYSAAAISLGESFKQRTRNKGLDTNKAASRHVAERIVHYLTTVVTVPFEAKGGFLFGQDVRPTEDADLVFVRRLTNREVQIALNVIAPKLAAEGITIHAVSREPKVIELEYGDPVDRYEITADCGTIRGNTHLDLGSANGPNAFSKFGEWRELPSLAKNVAPLRVRCQPLAAAAAEKLLAVLTQSETDYRIKHIADVLHEPLWEGVDCRAVARELLRTCRHRGIDIDALPETIGFPAIKRFEGAWQKHQSAGKTDKSVAEVYVSVEYLWQCVREELDLHLSPPLHEAAVPAQRVGGMR